ncbi:hypothetical protein FHW23_002799 [Curtobacterium pusillum]|uniref:Uncharacterized protein n=1 Tax=Curtobacterium pusillum TaxID=69373 RepID=A0AAW3TA17_9MICO|nr:hypothetical protein [Curtobacterium pusillum]
MAATAGATIAPVAPVAGTAGATSGPAETTAAS